ncbi:putative ATP-dependent RNA helicase YfmL [Jeotgalibaca dankookensis]|uniref:Putative ATP-dependent RNA helicase YfmL n=1 Tax=Jeotgalibaca dankookensis TaxID=708126 RepID=A0A1S6IM30_9LACT|nr:DEAD/DEAH box helicase [Jeotgalibaca dankookensis]AQS52600.1 putative ATP-dependent RNA helicase YfmL [Jeotgalibaca dankookensis]
MMIEEINDRFKRYWKAMSFQLPTPIQERSYQPLLNGEDVVGLSPTGTGKTLAYAIPLLSKLKRNGELQLVIITPSQELGVQVGRVLEEWAGLLDLNSQTLIGGASSKRQIESLKTKPEIVVGTTGRMLELSNQRKLKLHTVKTVVLDEADYLLQREHLDNVREFVKKMPGQRQMAFYSATDSENLRNISRWFNTDPIILDTADASVNQTEHGYVLTDNRKRAEMLRRIGNVKGMKALVFVNAVQELDYLAEKLKFENLNVLMLHSEYGTSQRKHALETFKNDEAVFLLTTDLSARGIDIPDLPYVINYDLPLSKEVYQHRSGRTGRMGKEGRVLSLANERGIREVKKLIPHPSELTEWFIYGGQLVDQLPEVEVETVKAPPKKVVRSKEKPEAKPTSKPKKKKRNKSQKNKGARRKTKD